MADNFPITQDSDRTSQDAPRTSQDAPRTAQDGKRVLVVGAGGFSGGFICDHGLKRGYRVTAGVRAATPRNYLTDPRIEFLVFDFEQPETMAKTLREALPDGEKWDYIIYNLGATKCLNFMEFNKINYEYLRHFTEALKQADMVPEKLLYASSLSALGPRHEKDGHQFRETDIPQPDTRYGASKLKAEMWLHTAGIPYIIFRATGIYGPRDHDYYLMFKSINRGFNFSVGYKPQLLSFIYVEDLAESMYDALEHAPTGETYNVAEPRTYTQAEFRKMACKAMKRHLVIPVSLPLWAVRAASWLVEKWGVAQMKPTTLNSDKYHILRQRNWSVDVGKAERDFGFRVRVPLEEGIERAIAWYKAESWL